VLAISGCGTDDLNGHSKRLALGDVRQKACDMRQHQFTASASRHVITIR
jgi:hypothetical protein